MSLLYAFLYLYFLFVSHLVFTGNVVLRNLVGKQSALDDLALPIKIEVFRIGNFIAHIFSYLMSNYCKSFCYTYLGELALTIPWTKLYKKRTQIVIRGVYLLIVPKHVFIFDETKEKVAAFQEKQKKLALIEVAKLREISGI